MAIIMLIGHYEPRRFSEQEKFAKGLSAGRFGANDIGFGRSYGHMAGLSHFPEFEEPLLCRPACPAFQPGAAPTSTTVAGRTGLPWEHRKTRVFSTRHPRR